VQSAPRRIQSRPSKHTKVYCWEENAISPEDLRMLKKLIGTQVCTEGEGVRRQYMCTCPVRRLHSPER
jgi:hypothetical protein